MVVPDVAPQVYVAVPEVVYPVSAAVVHVAPAASVSDPAVHNEAPAPPLIFHPLLAELKAAGTSHFGASQQAAFCVASELAAHGVAAQSMDAAVLLMV